MMAHLPHTTSERELLRRHVEAVWWLSLPPLDGEHVTLPAAGAQPPWALYLGAFYDGEQPIGRVHLWRHDVPAMERVRLATQADAALAQLPEAPLPDGVEREVALIQTAAPAFSRDAAARIARPLTAADRPLLAALWPGEEDDLLDPIRAPLYGVVVDDRLLTLAHSSRRTPHARELGIDTLPEGRRRGYALAATLLWAAAVAAEGIIPFYSARADNTASLALAHAAGYRPFAAGASIHI
jgi:hypothetical protein